MTELRKTGLVVLNEMPWGTHCCHFYQTQCDLLETLVPYFKVGLESRERCVWVIHEPVTEAKARRAVRRGIPDGERHLAEGSIELVAGREWYLKRGTFSLKRVMREWDQKLERALARGYAGLRVNGDTGWLERKDWKHFQGYERTLNESLIRKAMIVLCGYPLAACGATEVLDVARTHHYAIAKRRAKWEVVEWRTPPSASDAYETLTPREREVLRQAAEGFSNPEIADRLSIGVRTVESHRANLMRKLGLRNQADVVRYALNRGLLPVERTQR